MPLFTTVWNLLKKNPATDGNDIFNIQTMLNDNWDKLDAVLGMKAVNADVRVATAGNIDLSGLQTIDGVTLTAGDRVLVKDQATDSDNGIYIATADAWARSPDADTTAKLAAGLFVHVKEGNANVGTGWILATTGTITLGSTSLIFVQKTGAGAATDAVVGSRTIDDSIIASSGADTPTRLWSKLGNMIKAITGKANWWTPPATSIEALNTNKLNATAYTAADVLAKIKTVDGAGSGLDADTIDGLHLTDLTVSKSLLSGIDLNTVTATGIYRLGDNLVNGPSGVDYGQLLVLHGGGDTIAQMAFSFGGIDVYSRAGNPAQVGGNGGWGSWNRIWNSARLPNPARTDATNTFTDFQRIQRSLSGSNQLFAEWNAPDKITYQWIIETSGNLSLWNSTNSVVAARFAPNGGNAWTSGNNPANFDYNGYQKLASGLIIQYGSATVGSNTVRISNPFPITFPNGVRSMVVTMGTTVNSDTAVVSNLTNSSYEVTFGTLSGTTTRTLRWMAMGF
ncbi:pyocin knob domain-containing protein [Cohnella zeiphila]|uniref:Putative tail fiber protein gp53-like C-terminal domain-containing protein n=1 Tax=Cohnella zeiphila TaxID=2761120 RepID=A0A7X0SHH6_9BACL|nr:hypothetical protein [Cohnella zeiphila]MBB6730066.1 hypothetical protein [Cohnella zeiphila]